MRPGKRPVESFQEGVPIVCSLRSLTAICAPQQHANKEGCMPAFKAGFLFGKSPAQGVGFFAVSAEDLRCSSLMLSKHSFPQRKCLCADGSEA